MKYLRSHPEQFSYLKTSIVVLTNSFIRKMVKLVFSIQSPQSHVYLAPDLIHANGIIREIRTLLIIVIVFYPIQKCP